MADEFIPYPQAQDDPNEYAFTPAELAEIERHVAKYPERQAAVMPALWIAQEKWGWLPQKAIQLVADTLGLSYAHVYGVATFYTMYLKENRAPNLIEVCTCFGCHISGGQACYDKLKARLKVDAHGISADRRFYLREAECLGSCDTSPVIQVNNRRLVHNVDDTKMEWMIEKLTKGEEIPYERIPLKDQSAI
jgi:NADH-quinone oxidoreductase subunit E